MEEMIIAENEVQLTEKIYSKFERMSSLIGHSSKGNYWGNGRYLLIHLRLCLEIYIPYVIEKNYNFFNERETKILEELYFEVIELLKKFDECNKSKINEIMNKFMSLYNTINNFFELRLYIYRRNILLIELQKILEETDYAECRTRLVGAKEDITKLKKEVLECEKLVIEDWGKKLTNPNEYQPGEKFAFICHTGSLTTSRLVSASLITDRVMAGYNTSYVFFILDHSTMFNVSSRDAFIQNSLKNDPMLATLDNLFSLLTKETVEEQTLQAQEEWGKNHYNEVDLYECEPLGILILIDNDIDESFYYERGEEYHEKYPNLPIIYIRKSWYKPKKGSILSRKIVSIN